MTDFRADLLATEEEYQEVVNRGDIDAIAQYYAEEARIMPPGSETIAGRDAIREYFCNLAGLGITKSELEVEEVGGEGCTAFLRYSSKLYKTDGSLYDDGKGVCLYRKEDDGKWRIILDVANSNMQ